MAKFKNSKDLAAHLRKASEALLREVVVQSQRALGSSRVSPIDTGRLRSSWFAAESTASNAVAPEGTNAANDDAKGLKVNLDREYHLTNNLPYAQRVCLEGHVFAKPSSWFTDFRNSRIPKIRDEAARQIKREFDL